LQKQIESRVIVRKKPPDRTVRRRFAFTLHPLILTRTSRRSQGEGRRRMKVAARALTGFVGFVREV
jgi:hypothetical protein